MHVAYNLAYKQEKLLIKTTTISARRYNSDEMEKVYRRNLVDSRSSIVNVACGIRCIQNDVKVMRVMRYGEPVRSDSDSVRNPAPSEIAHILKKILTQTQNEVAFNDVKLDNLIQIKTKQGWKMQQIDEDAATTVQYLIKPKYCVPRTLQAFYELSLKQLTEQSRRYINNSNHAVVRDKNNVEYILHAKSIKAITARSSI